MVVDVEAEHHGNLDGPGIQCATALERLTCHSLKQSRQTQFTQVGETASPPASGASSCANSTATGASES